MDRVYRIGTRKSPLALKQVEEILAMFEEARPDIEFDIVGFETKGDKDQITPISRIEGTDFFTREVDDALLKGDVDFVIHSAKDLPDQMDAGLAVAVFTSSIDKDDVLVSKNGYKINELPWGAKIGTSSLRRKTQLKKYRNDFDVVDIRGNIGERLRKLDTSDLEAIVIAAAGLIRLGLEHKITQRLPYEIMQPHPLQGSLAVIARESDKDVRHVLSALNQKSEKGVIYAN